MIAKTILICLCALSAAGQVKTENFDRDPGWEGLRNRFDASRSNKKSGLGVVQDFGYSQTNFAGKEKGEIGGVVQRSVTPAYYAAEISPKTLDDKLSASGTFAMSDSHGSAGVFFGWFNSQQPSGGRESSLGFHLAGAGGGARMSFRLVTGTNQACGTKVTEWIKGRDVERYTPASIKGDGTRYAWKMDYDPQANSGNGQMQLTIHGNGANPDKSFEGKTFTVDVPAGYKQQKTTFDRFGLANAMKSGNPMTIYFDDLQFDGKSEDFSKDPQWIALGNQTKFEDHEQTGLHDFGYSETNHAGGSPGEVGGLMWRAGSYAYYADKIGPLGLNDRLEASGKVVLQVAAQDSGMYFGWFNSADKENGPTQAGNFLGIKVGGPTHVGHYFLPAYATAKDTPIQHKGKSDHAVNVSIDAHRGPVLVPEKVYEWKLVYDPAANDGKGSIRVTLGGESITLDLKNGDKAKNAHFDRFGLFTNHIGGSFVKIYLDDLSYTAGPQK
jgi:hypothetical protein